MAGPTIPFAHLAVLRAGSAAKRLPPDSHAPGSGRQRGFQPENVSDTAQLANRRIVVETCPANYYYNRFRREVYLAGWIDVACDIGRKLGLNNFLITNGTNC